MNKTIKIFENEANIYSGNCYVNIAKKQLFFQEITVWMNL